MDIKFLLVLKKFQGFNAPELSKHQKCPTRNMPIYNIESLSTNPDPPTKTTMFDLTFWSNNRPSHFFYPKMLA